MKCPRCSLENWLVMMQFDMTGLPWETEEDVVLNQSGDLNSAFCQGCGFGMHKDANNHWSSNLGDEWHETTGFKKKEVQRNVKEPELTAFWKV